MELERSPKAVLFDAYGTLFDVYSVAERADALFPGKGATLSALWREKQIDYTRLRTLSAPDGAHYKPFWDITRDGLRYACERLELALTPERETALMDAYKQLAPFAENRAVLQQLKTRGLQAGVLSNGDPQMLAWSIESAGFTELLPHVLSVHSVRKFKTAPEAYALGPVALGLAASDILFVSSNCWDACAATWVGYQTLWVNRTGLPLEALDVAPHKIGSSLNAVLDFFE
jgi:2-haloacid dehalogenase